MKLNLGEKVEPASLSYCAGWWTARSDLTSSFELQGPLRDIDNTELNEGDGPDILTELSITIFNHIIQELTC